MKRGILRSNSLAGRVRFFVRRLLVFFLWVMVFFLLFLALNQKDPHFLEYRKFEPFFILSSCAAGFFVSIRKSRGLLRPALAGLFAAVALISLTGEALYGYRKSSVLDRKFETERIIGSHFVVGYDSMDDLKTLAEKGIIGGVFVTSKNIAGKSASDIRSEIAALQETRRRNGLPRLIVATDQEGGIVSRMSPPLEKRPSLADIVKTVLGKERNGATEPDLQKILHAEIENYGKQQGRELANIGINVNFSPVVDLKSVNNRNLLDFHSLINRRAISDDPVITADAALAYCIGLDSQGVLPTLKHFPGLGRVSSDTHHFSAKLEATPDELVNRDWLPFQSVSCRSRSLIMLGHVVLSDTDNENPVSFSRRVVQEIIRGKWKHEGLLITDDLTMAAAYSYGIGEACVRALNAGVDLVLISADHEKFYEAMYYAVDAYENGGVDLKALNTSRDRLAKQFYSK